MEDSFDSLALLFFKSVMRPHELIPVMARGEGEMVEG